MATATDQPTALRGEVKRRPTVTVRLAGIGPFAERLSDRIEILLESGIVERRTTAFISFHRLKRKSLRASVLRPSAYGSWM